MTEKSIVKIQTIHTLIQREYDTYGSGYYGASRDGGTRVHQGEDKLARPGELVLSPFRVAVVGKYGYTYKNDLSYRYVELRTSETDGEVFLHQFYYVAPIDTLSVGDVVYEGAIIGVVQDLDKRYKGIPNHIHYQIVDKTGSKINPSTEYWDKYMV